MDDGLPVAARGIGLRGRGRDGRRRGRPLPLLGYWDALLLATAAEAGCAAAIPDDMADGAALGTIRVVPAFAGGQVSAAARALL